MQKILALFLLILCTARPAWAQDLDGVKVRRGEISLANWDKSHALSLKGQWFFFPREHLTPRAFLERWRQNPATLRTAVTGQRFQDVAPDLFQDDFGIATYALVLHQLPEGQLALEGASIYTSALLQAFAVQNPEDSLVSFKIGEAGLDKASSRPLTAKDMLLPLHTDAGASWVILIHASNFHHSWGGVWLPPRIGDFQQLSHTLKFYDKLNYWLLGLIFFLAIYSFALYLRRPKDRPSLLLAIFSLVMLVRLLLLAEAATPLIPNSTWKFELTFKTIYATMMLGPLSILYFVKSCFPERIPSSWVKALTAILALPILVILFTPATIYGHLSNFLKITTLIVGALCIGVLIRGARARDEGALMSLTGFLVVVTGGALDVMNSYGFDSLPTNSTAIGMTVFIICQSQIVASRFARAFHRSEHLSCELQSEVEKQTRDIKSILTHIRQGIFTIRPGDKKIDELHSEYLKQLTHQTQMSGQSLRSLILDRARLSEEQKSLTESSLDAALGEDPINFEINSSNLLRELEFTPPGSNQTRMLELDWNPMLDKDRLVEKILVSIRDVTDLRSLEAHARQQEEDMKVIMELIRIPEDRFHRFIEKTRHYLRENRDLIRRSPTVRQDVLKRLFVNIHTIKGSARTYYLGALANVSHEVEQYYADLQKQKLPWDVSRLLHDLDRVESVVEHYRFVSQNSLGWQSGQQAIRMSRKKIEYTLEMLARLEAMDLNQRAHQCLHEAQRVLLRTCYTELHGVIEEGCRGLDSMARDLGKATPIVEIAPNAIVLKDRGADLLHSLLIHLLRNSLDHGLEKAEERVRQGKSPQGKIRMWTDIREPFVNLHYSDDGKGLDLIKLEEIGKKRGLLTPQFTVQEVAELIFRSGLSTKDEVSEISGRGVGLDAVRSYLEEQGGCLQIVLDSVTDRAHVPFTLIMSLPLSLCFLTRHVHPAAVDVAG